MCELINSLIYPWIISVTFFIVFNVFWKLYGVYRILNNISRLIYTTWKVSVFGIILVRIFPHSDWIRRDTPYLSVFSPNADQNNSEHAHFSRSVYQSEIYAMTLV